MRHECARCGAVAAPGSAFCDVCRDEPAGAIPSMVSSSRPSRSGPPASAVPTPLWAAVGLTTAAGLYLLVPNLLNLPEELDLLTVGRWQDNLIFLVLLVLELLFGAACLYLAIRLVRADQVGRLMTVAAAGSLLLGLLVANSGSNTTAVAIVGAFAVVVILTMIEGVTAHFTGRHSAQPPGPASVVAAHRLLVVLGAVLFLTGVAFTLLGSSEVNFIMPVGIVLLLVGVEAEIHAPSVRAGGDTARKWVTGSMAVCVAALIFLNLPVTAIYLLVGLAGAIMALLWIPEESRRHFTPRV